MAKLLDITLRLMPEMSSRNFYYDFYVPEGVSHIRIDYRYAPKYLQDEAVTDALIEEGLRRYTLPDDPAGRDALRREARPLVNLVTLSLDGPEGYAGAAHRHDPEQIHIIGGEETSPGFDPATLKTGMWRACVSTHAVVTRECIVHLIIEEA